MRDLKSFIPEIESNIRWIDLHLKEVLAETLWHDRLKQQQRNMKICIRRINLFEKSNYQNKDSFEEINSVCQKFQDNFIQFRSRFLGFFGEEKR